MPAVGEVVSCECGGVDCGARNDEEGGEEQYDQQGAGRRSQGLLSCTTIAHVSGSDANTILLTCTVGASVRPSSAKSCVPALR